jgi:hypothetical protein
MIEKKLSRREFLHISALTAAGVALAGCQPTATEPPPAEVEEPAAPTEAPPEPEGKVIQYWFSWGNFLPVWEEGLMAT